MVRVKAAHHPAAQKPNSDVRDKWTKWGGGKAPQGQRRAGMGKDISDQQGIWGFRLLALEGAINPLPSG